MEIISLEYSAQGPGAYELCALEKVIQFLPILVLSSAEWKLVAEMTAS